MDKRFWAILGVIGIVFVGVLVFKGGDEKASDTSTGPTNHITGKVDSSVKLVEYGDYQCPFCALYHSTLKQVVEKYKDQISFQYRNYPLSQTHQNAFAAARAAEAADAQGNFWAMYDMLFQSQQVWKDTNAPQSTFTGFAKQLGLNVDKFSSDYASKKVNDAINADIKAFNDLGLKKSTPTFLLNGKQIQPENSVESFSKFIDEALAKKQ